MLLEYYRSHRTADIKSQESVAGLLTCDGFTLYAITTVAL